MEPPDEHKNTDRRAEEESERRRRDRAERYVARVHAIRAFNANETGDFAFMARPLVQLTLPHTDPGDVQYYKRSNGDLHLVVQSGFRAEEGGELVLAGIPFGSYPRLILAWVTTEAVRTRSSTLCLGGSLTAFMSELGLVRGGRTVLLLREQMARLFTARIAIVRGVKNGVDQTAFEVARQTKLWWDPHHLSEPVTSRSTVQLSDDFFHLLTERPVPLDMRALHVLKESPLGLDLYMWLTYRVSYMRRETVIPWTALQAQMGADYGRTDNFSRKVKRELRRIKLVWPELDFATLKGRLVLKPCPPHVRPRLKA